MTEVKQGALLIDQGKVGIVVRIYKIGATSENESGTQNIHWEESYHIYYFRWYACLYKQVSL